MCMTDYDPRSFHEQYDDPSTWQFRRLPLVQQCIKEALGATLPPATIVDMCAGEGRDLLPLLSPQDSVRAKLVEIDADCADIARAAARDLPGVEVVTGDAALTDHYADFAPADLVLMSGIFPHIDKMDKFALVKHAASLVVRGGLLIWTMNDPDRANAISAAFVMQHFEPVRYFDVGGGHTVHMARHMAAAERLSFGEKMFTFVGFDNLSPKNR